MAESHLSSLCPFLRQTYSRAQGVITGCGSYLQLICYPLTSLPSCVTFLHQREGRRRKNQVNPPVMVGGDPRDHPVPLCAAEGYTETPRLMGCRARFLLCPPTPSTVLLPQIQPPAVRGRHCGFRWRLGARCIQRAPPYFFFDLGHMNLFL